MLLYSHILLCFSRTNRQSIPFRFQRAFSGTRRYIFNVVACISVFRNKWRMRKWTEKELKASFGNRREKKENYSLLIWIKNENDEGIWKRNTRKKKIGTKKEMTKKEENKSAKMVERQNKCMKLCISHKVTTSCNLLPI